MKFTEHQEAVFDFLLNGTGHAIVEAVAGSGKTTTLVEATRRISQTGKSVALCAYNTKMGNELKERTKSMVGVFAGTLHSFGFRAIVNNPVTVDGKKIKPIMEKNKVRLILASKQMLDDRLFKYSPMIEEMVRLAKDTGIGFFCPVDEKSKYYDLIDKYDLTIENGVCDYEYAIAEAIDVLRRSNADLKTFDFSDMVYLPLLRNLKVWQNDFVFIDEAQDTNPTRRALASKMLKGDGRLVAVGDPHQAIFGFTGADNDALEQIREAFGAITLPLTVSFRCPVKVVELARNYVDHITAHKSNEEGIVGTATYEEVTSELNPLNLGGGDAILCRKNAPLIDTAFNLIRKGIPCKIEGRDVANQLISLCRKWKVSSLEQLQKRVDDYCDREVQKALAKGNDMKAERIKDKVETLNVLIERAEEKSLDVSELTSMIADMFGDSEKGETKKLLVLSSVHKAKGLEWSRVFGLGMHQFMPSSWARQNLERQQERNLAYV